MICAMMKPLHDVWSWPDAERAGGPCTFAILEEASVSGGLCRIVDHVVSILNEYFSR